MTLAAAGKLTARRYVDTASTSTAPPPDHVAALLIWASGHPIDPIALDEMLAWGEPFMMTAKSTGSFTTYVSACMFLPWKGDPVRWLRCLHRIGTAEILKSGKLW